MAKFGDVPVPADDDPELRNGAEDGFDDDDDDLFADDDDGFAYEDDDEDQDEDWERVA